MGCPLLQSLNIARFLVLLVCRFGFAFFFLVFWFILMLKKRVMKFGGELGLHCAQLVARGRGDDGSLQCRFPLAPLGGVVFALLSKAFTFFVEARANGIEFTTDAISLRVEWQRSARFQIL